MSKFCKDCKFYHSVKFYGMNVTEVCKNQNNTKTDLVSGETVFIQRPSVLRVMVSRCGPDGDWFQLGDKNDQTLR